MSVLFRLSGAKRHHVGVEEWLYGAPAEPYAIARKWFCVMRECGDDVHELIHDDCPVACVDDAAFCYVNVFKTHVNVGFYCGADLNDPGKLLQGSGKRMRHVKLKPNQEIDSKVLQNLIRQAYKQVRMDVLANH